MNDIRQSVEAAIAYLRSHPAEARYTDSRATATLEKGLRFRVKGPGGESILTDMPKGIGGDGGAVAGVAFPCGAGGMRRIAHRH